MGVCGCDGGVDVMGGGCDGWGCVDVMGGVCGCDGGVDVMCGGVWM